MASCDSGDGRRRDFADGLYPELIKRRFDAAETERIRRAARGGARERSTTRRSRPCCKQRPSGIASTADREIETDSVSWCRAELRTREDRVLPAANALSLGFITLPIRSGRRLADDAQLDSRRNSNGEAGALRDRLFIKRLEELDRLVD